MHSKEVLAEFIYKLDKISQFRFQSTFWSAPIYGFSHNNSLPSKFMKELQQQNILSEDINAVICVLGD